MGMVKKYAEIAIVAALTVYAVNHFASNFLVQKNATDPTKLA